MCTHVCVVCAHVYDGVCLCGGCVCVCGVCVPGCEEEPRCFLADLRDADSWRFHSCSLYPDSGECGGYEDPLTQRCALVLDTPPNNTYSKTGNQRVATTNRLYHLTRPVERWRTWPSIRGQFLQNPEHHQSSVLGPSAMFTRKFRHICSEL